MKRVLFIAHRVPYPPDKGERIRAFHQLKALAGEFRVSLAAPAHRREDFRSAEALKPWCQDVFIAPAGRMAMLRGLGSLVRGRSVTEGMFASRRLMRFLRDAAARERFDVVLGSCSSTLPYVLAVPAAARIIDLVDIDSAKWAAYADSAGWPRRWLFRREARTVGLLEQQAVARCDAVAVVSQAEARLLPGRPAKLLVVGNGVDLDYYAPRPAPPSAPPGLVFIGTMSYPPNVEGVRWFARMVWPGLSRRMPDLTFTIVGRDPPRAVRQLAGVAGIRVTGSVPDVRPFLAEAMIAVVPLRLARGVQNKVLEAMAMGRAVVASPAAVQGLEVTVGDDLLQADTPEEWHEQVLNLLTNADLRNGIELSARRCVEDRYSWTASLEPLLALCRQLAAGGAGVGSGRPDESAVAAATRLAGA